MDDNDAKMPRTEEEWRDILTEEQYRVLRQKDTEAPFTGRYVDEHSEGTYSCAACGNLLFSSKAKFDSGSGWPSYATPLAEDRVVLVEDKSHGLERTEVLCARCGSHLGHMFEDGPVAQGGKRYCINSVCLDLNKEETN